MGFFMVAIALCMHACSVLGQGMLYWQDNNNRLIFLEIKGALIDYDNDYDNDENDYDGN